MIIILAALIVPIVTMIFNAYLDSYVEHKPLLKRKKLILYIIIISWSILTFLTIIAYITASVDYTLYQESPLIISDNTPPYIVIQYEQNPYIIYNIEDNETIRTEVRRFDTNIEITVIPNTKGRLIIYNKVISSWQRFFVLKLPKYYVLEIPQI